MPDSAGTLNADTQPPELGENKSLLFKPPMCGIWLWQTKQTHTSTFLIMLL